MICLDTSVVVRYLVGTPPDQGRRAAALIDASDAVGVPLVVLVETAHVLRTQYGVARGDVIGALLDLVTRENVTVLGLPTPETIEALVRSRSLAGTPIPDAFIAATARSSGAVPVFTFDREFRRHGVPVSLP